MGEEKAKIELLIAIVIFGVISLIIFFKWMPSIEEILWGVFFVIWNLIMIFYVSKLVAARWNKYIARKFIHFTTGGLVAVLVPYIFKVPTIPVVGAFLMALITIAPRVWNRELDWFQVKNNFGDTYFCISWGILFLIFWYIDLYIAIVASLMMAFGDGVTGIVRSIIYKKWVKGWWGTLAMLLVSLPIGYIYKGIGGVFSGIIATIIERLPYIDDNITVPAFAALTLYLLNLKPI